VAYCGGIADLSFFVGIVVDNEAQSIIGQGKEIFKDCKPRKEDIVQE
jgi:LETM1 and EF-hand domain-containing protein 1, mitochondrial